MHAAHKALWFVEAHSRESFTLEQVADACAVSPFHLTRAFAALTGLSLMRYVRARRLSEAAHQLAAGASDILSLALELIVARDVPAGFTVLNVPAQQYAVFTHREHIAGIRETMAAI